MVAALRGSLLQPRPLHFRQQEVQQGMYLRHLYALKLLLLLHRLGQRQRVCKVQAQRRQEQLIRLR